jgi:hypothetical protein
MKPESTRHRWTWREFWTGFFVTAAVLFLVAVAVIKGTE